MKLKFDNDLHKSLRRFPLISELIYPYTAKLLNLNIFTSKSFFLTLTLLYSVILTGKDSHGFDSVAINQSFQDINNKINIKESDCIATIDSLIELSLENNYSYGYAKGKASLGKVYLLQNNYDSAVHNYRIAIKQLEMHNNKIALAKAYNNLAYAEQQLGNYNKALENYLKAYEIFNFLKSTEHITSVCNNLGSLYYTLDQPAKAEKFYKLTLHFNKELNDSIITKDAYANLGNLFYSQMLYDSALFYFEEALLYELILNDDIGKGKTLNSLGAVYLILNRDDEASEVLTRALHLARRNNDYNCLMSVYSNLGDLHLKRNANRLATNYYDSCLIIAQDINDINQIMSSYLSLSNAYEKRGQYAQSLKYYKQHEQYKSTLLLEHTMVAETESLFTKQKQENKILRLEKEYEKRKSQITLLLSLIIVLITLSVSLFLIYRAHQKNIISKKLAEKQKDQFKAVIEAQDEERKRIASELHDSVGQMLSVIKLNVSDFEDNISIEKEDNEMLQKTLQYIDDTCNEVRSISHNLMPGALIRFGLTSAIKELIRKINTSRKISFNFTSNQIDERISEKVELALYRMVQEILNNAIKHSKADQITIDLNKIDQSYILNISDNGVGFDSTLIDTSKGIGWKNINSRLSFINGTIDIQSKIGSGTSITISVPIRIDI